MSNSPQKIKIVCISDTHNRHRALELPQGDILIHAGDQAEGRGSLEEIVDFNNWMGELDFKHKIAIAGNHDFIFQENWSVIKNYTSNYIYLKDEWYEAEGLKFYGSPWQPAFCNWAFNLPRGGTELAKKWRHIPDDTNVLITHGPPFGIGDKIPGVTNAGCKLLKSRVRELTSLKLHVFGHIHEGYGQEGIFVNASVLDKNYKLNNSPIVVEIER